MSAILREQRKYTPEEYAELEKASEERLEYFEGNVWSMAGASPNHEIVVANVITELNLGARGRSCLVFGSNLRVKVPIYPPYRYPDVSALCDKPVYEDFHGLQVLVNPALIVEILSPSTEAFDMSDKFTYYKSIESLTEYLLVGQDRPHITLYTKQSADGWLQREFNSLNDKIYLSSLDCEISVREIYANVEFQPVENPKHPFQITDLQ
ncbi:MAG: Uma2 family endonuclease [Acidobacteriota bacterium]|nr:Uma2 family endonuclease [Acidobacteriota bacterium]